jgi:hypothetical protein
MRDENEPDQAADHEYQRSGDEYLLQHFHICSLSNNVPAAAVGAA